MLRLAAFTMLFCATRGVSAQSRLMTPEDLFRIEQIGAIAWAPDRQRASVELPRAKRWVDQGIPTAEIGVVDVAQRSLRKISSPSRAYAGFFGAAWSPNGRRLLFFSVDTNAVVRPWLWESTSATATMVPGVQMYDGLLDRAVALWSDNDHAVFMTRDSTAPLQGPFRYQLSRGSNVADLWKRARAGTQPTGMVVEFAGKRAGANGATAGALASQRDGQLAAQFEVRLVSRNLRTGATTPLAKGLLHRPRLSADGRTVTYRQESDLLALTLASSYFGPEARGEAAYDRPNWGSEVHHVDAKSGASVPAPTAPSTATSAAQQAPTTSIRVVNDSTLGSRLLLSTDTHTEVELWKGNQWLRDIRTGRAESVAYSSQTGASLTGWILYPPDHVAGRRLPVVTIVYPGSVYSQRKPAQLNPLNSNFEHPQLFAALGYAVVLPTMPPIDSGMAANEMETFTDGVVPLVDTLIARGIADSTRIALLGQSAGGYATLGIISQTNRFRSAIASASYSNLTSFYGTFYGQYRYGDSGAPLRAQLLRMLQFERGFMGAQLPPWEAPERYQRNSPISRAAHINTPLMLVHGEIDFIPIQQAEEMFTALYRQDKQVRLVRYAGEEHTITAKQNVLHFWKQVESWLRETIP